MGLELYLITEDEASATLITPTLVANIEEEVTEIGREPSDASGIKLDSKTVSRVHGIFQKINSHWFFKDSGSSNGSWLNGKHLSADQYYLLRSGDELQLADSFLGIKIDDQTENIPSILVFSRGQLNDEVMVPENGKFLTIGGSRSQFKLDVDFGSLPQFVIEKRSDFLCIYPVSSENRTTVNGAVLDNLRQIKDRDIIEIAPYMLIVNAAQSSDMHNKAASSIVDWDEQEKQPKSNFFGRFKAKANEEELDPAELIQDLPKNNSKKELLSKLESAEEKLVLILGFLLVLSILVAVLWWFLR